MRKSAFCLTLLAVVALAVPAQAGVITYILSDHPNAALFNSNDPCCNRFLADVPLSGKGGPYGLRVDWLNDEPQTQNQGPTFSVSSGGALVNLDWDDGTNTMTIYGQVRHNTTGVLWDVFYELSGATVVPKRILVRRRYWRRHAVRWHYDRRPVPQRERRRSGVQLL